MPFDWLPGAGLGVAGAALAWWRSSGVSEAKFQERIETLKSEMAAGTKLNERNDDEFKRDLYSAVAELRAVTLTLAKLTSGQDVINAMTAKTLESLARRQEEQGVTITEMKATTTLITEWLKRIETR